jgi:hypothetical protein
MHQLFTYFKKAYDSVKREVLYNILLEFLRWTDPPTKESYQMSVDREAH